MSTTTRSYFTEHSFRILQACTEVAEKTAKCGLVFRGITIMTNLYGLSKMHAIFNIAKGLILVISVSHIIVQDSQKVVSSFSKKLEPSGIDASQRANRCDLYQISQMEAVDIASCIKAIVIGCGALSSSYFLGAPITFGMWIVSRIAFDVATDYLKPYESIQSDED